MELSIPFGALLVKLPLLLLVLTNLLLSVEGVELQLRMCWDSPFLLDVHRELEVHHELAVHPLALRLAVVDLGNAPDCRRPHPLVPTPAPEQ